MVEENERKYGRSVHSHAWVKPMDGEFQGTFGV